MRTSHPWLALAARLALLAAAIWAVLPSRVALLVRDDAVTREIARSRTSSLFVLHSKGWTSFAIPAGQSRVKIVSNADVPEAVYPIQDLTCEYVLRCQLLDGEGRVIRDQGLVQRSSPLNYRAEETGAILPAQTYLGVPLAPLSSRTALINLEGLEDSSHLLKLTLAQADSRVMEVAVRVYVNEKPPAYKLRYLWQRLAAEKRERLARASVHGPELLTDTEKANLLENRWVAVAPQGIAGVDYVDRTLYTLRERYGAVPTGAILPRGVLVGPGTLGTIPVPEGGGCIRLDLQPVSASGPPPAVLVAWHRRGAVRPVETEVRLDQGSRTHEGEYDGGLLEIESPEDIVARAYLEGGPAEVEITPDPRCAQAYRVRRDAPIEFSILNGGGEQGAFRLDVRGLPLPEPQVPSPAPERAPAASGMSPAGQAIRLAYALLDDKRNVIGAGSILNDRPDSWHDRMTGSDRTAAVSDASRHYFCLPPRCAFFRVSSECDSACVTAYTRPFSLPRQVKVPEDYLAFERAQDDSRTWFPLRPEDYSRCLTSECEVFIRVAQRPPGPPEDWYDGNWHSDVCKPVSGPVAGSARARERTVSALKVLTPVGDDSAGLREITRAYFVKLERGRPADLYLGDASGEALVAPRLICLKPDDSPLTLTILVDGKAHVQERVSSRSHETVLPPLEAGWREVSFDASDAADVYLGGLLVPSRDLYLERTVHRLGKSGLTYRVLKETPATETLAARLYLPSAGGREASVGVSVKGAGKIEGAPVDSWTFPESSYRIRAPQGDAVPVVGAGEGPLSGGELFLVTLGADLAPGGCDVSFRLESGPPGYLSVLHLVPGAGEERRFASEPSLAPGGSSEDE